MYNGGSSAERRGSSLEARDGGSGHTSDQAGQENEQRPGAVLSILPEPPMLDRFLLTPASKTGVPGPPQEAQPSRGCPYRQARPLRPQEQTPKTLEPGSSEEVAPGSRPHSPLGFVVHVPGGTGVQGPFQSRRAPRTDGLAVLGTGLTGKESPSSPMTWSMKL